MTQSASRHHIEAYAIDAGPAKAAPYETKPKRKDRCIFVDHGRKLVIAVNYKCGWSTFNQHVGQRSELNLPNPANLAAARREGYRVVLFARTPLSRLVSYLNDKIVLRRGNFEIVRRALQSWNSLDILDALQAAGDDRAALATAIDTLLPYLPMLMQRDGHLHPQHRLYTTCGFGPHVFDEILDYRSNIDFLRTNYGINASIGNITRSGELGDILATSRVRMFCEAWYGLDQHVWDTCVAMKYPTAR